MYLSDVSDVSLPLLDLVTPTMMGPPAGKSPSKRPRPLLRVLATDDTFREKRHKSHDHMPKTPATQGWNETGVFLCFQYQLNP